MSGIRCDVCGHFVAYTDLDSGAARHEMVTPDSHLTIEEWDTPCPPCNAKDKQLVIRQSQPMDERHLARKMGHPAFEDQPRKKFSTEQATK